jgi:hypothetical protein
MMELCPHVEESNKFFLFVFLKPLPEELHILLDEDYQMSP